MANQDDFIANINEAARCMLQAANYLAFAIDAAEDGTPVVLYWNMMDDLREKADTIDPPMEDWPENVIPLTHAKRRK